MATDSGTTTSLWPATAALPEANPLADDLTADVCVVGAGITAYLRFAASRRIAFNAA